MSVFRSIESRLANLVEGSFSRAFKSEVRPVEIARRLAREMDQNRTAFVSRVYVPTHYTVYLGTADFERFEPHQEELKSELASYLLEHARRENLVLAERPRIDIGADDRLGLGEFGIRTDPVDRSGLAGGEQAKAPARQPQPQPPAPKPATPPRMTPPAAPVSAPRPAPAEPVPVPVPAPSVPAADQAATVAPAGAGAARLAVAGMAIDLDGAGNVLGRSRDCDIVLEDPNASRRHARIAQDQSGWIVEDLGSTNGVLVNGARVAGSRALASGDVIRLGHTDLTFETA